MCSSFIVALTAITSNNFEFGSLRAIDQSVLNLVNDRTWHHVSRNGSKERDA
jgi:hypothetical protein